MSKIICNAGPVIGLAGIDKLNLLWELFDEVVIPEAVYSELCVKNHGNDTSSINSAIKSGHIKVITISNNGLISSMVGKLHKGELETIIGAKTDPDIHYAVIDEKAARAFAATLLIDTTGILGILRLAKTKGIIKAVKPHVDSLIQNGYYISSALYEQVLKRENEK